MNRVVLTEYNGDQMSRSMGERHTNKTNKRGPLIRSTPSSWSEKSRRIKRSRKEIIGYKRSPESGSSGPERKIWKGSVNTMNTRTLSSNDSNVLPKYSKKRRTQDKVASSTSGYNLRPRGGREVESRPVMEMKTQQGGPVRSRIDIEGTTTLTSKSEQDQATGIQDEEVIHKGRTKKGKERVPEDPCP
ncbi:uncharacterized protein TNCV_380771 [Trichonephila clavipes]|nr:uncharacterized protein TNCV_380771 [Trichonephila clavipes]